MHEFWPLLAQDIGISTWLAEAAAAGTRGAPVAFHFAFAADIAGLHFLGSFKSS